jgi:hypothetical protein
MQIACNIPLERYWQGLQLFLKPYLNQKFAHKVMGVQSCESPNFGNLSRDSHLGVPGQNAIWMWASWRGTKYTIRGKVVASPKLRPWWVLWIRVCSWFILAPKVFQLCTDQFVVWFMQVRVSDLVLAILPSPIPELQHALLPPKCYKLGNLSLTPCFFVVFTTNSHLSLSRNLGVLQLSPSQILFSSFQSSNGHLLILDFSKVHN